MRKSGKPVLAYATGYTDDGYQLAAHASEIWLNPLGAVALAGPGGNNLYYKGLLDKLGVTANVYRVGTYKAAVEPYTRTDMSPEARANCQALAGAMLETWRDDVAARGPPRPHRSTNYLRDPVGDGPRRRRRLRQAPRSPTSWSTASASATRSNARLAELGGEDDDKRGPLQADQARRLPAAKSIPAPTAARSASSPSPARSSTARPARDAPAATASPKLIDKGVAQRQAEGAGRAHRQPRRVGDGVRANPRRRSSPPRPRACRWSHRWAMSPRRAAIGSRPRPTAIFAEPSTITGSIGVFGILPSFEGSLAKLGVGADGIKTTPLSGEPDLLDGPSPEADALIQAGVESIYRRFLGLVADVAAQERRPRSTASRRAACGTAAPRASSGWSTSSAGSTRRSPRPPQLAKIDDRGVTYLEPPSFEDGCSSCSPATSDEARRPTPSRRSRRRRPIARARIGEVSAILAGPSIQVRCLECPPVRGARRGREAGELLSGLIRDRCWSPAAAGQRHQVITSAQSEARSTDCGSLRPCSP